MYKVCQYSSGPDPLGKASLHSTTREIIKLGRPRAIWELKLTGELSSPLSLTYPTFPIITRSPIPPLIFFRIGIPGNVLPPNSHNDQYAVQVCFLGSLGVLAAISIDPLNVIAVQKKRVQKKRIAQSPEEIIAAFSA